MVMPVASITWALLGTLTALAAPTAVIFPPCITTTPFSITPCVIVNSLPPFRATGLSWVKAGVDRSKSKIKTKIKGKGRGRPLHTGWFADGCITLPPCSASFPGLVALGRSRLRHRLELFLALRSLRADNHPRSPGRHLCRHRSNRRDHLRLQSRRDSA